MSVSQLVSQINSNSGTTTSAASNADKSIVGKDDFLNLLVTQLKYQDPLDPQDPTEYTSQLAEFSSLEQLMSVNTSIEDLSSLQVLNTMYSSSSFVGQTVRMDGNTLSVKDGAASTVNYDLAYDAKTVTINIYNAKGDVVDTQEITDSKDLAAGNHAFVWDRQLDNNAIAPDDNYHFEVKATDADKNPINISTSFIGVVSGVSFANNQISLNINGKGYALGDLINIGDGAEAA